MESVTVQNSHCLLNRIRLLKVASQHTNTLIEKCKKGDQSAQFAIYKQYYAAMYNVALRIVSDRFEAEDVMQESFLSAFTKLDSFSEKVTFGAWLKRIVINNSITALKKNSRFETEPLEKVDLIGNRQMCAMFESVQTKENCADFYTYDQAVRAYLWKMMQPLQIFLIVVVSVEFVGFVSAWFSLLWCCGAGSMKIDIDDSDDDEHEWAENEHHGKYELDVFCFVFCVFAFQFDYFRVVFINVFYLFIFFTILK